MTDFKTKMAELAAKYNISHKRDIDWHNFVAEVEELTEEQPEKDCAELIESSKALFYDIDKCITALLMARFDKNEQHERKALSRMESLMVATQQQLCCITDYLSKEEGKQSVMDCNELKNVHDLKILPEYFQAIKSGEKTFEVRFNDRNFQKGDVLHLREWNGSNYTGESIFVEVTYILDNPDFCKEGYVIMAIKQKEQKEEDEHLLSAIQVQFASHAKVENGKRYAKLTWDEFKKIAFELCGCGKQKPAEWSEEDEKKMIFLERLIEHNVPDGQYGWADGRKGGFVTKSEAISMLKSLRHQSKRDCKDCAMFLNGDCTKPRWEPSEEQMKALLNAEGYLWEGDQFDSAKSIAQLYEQLKKL